MNTFHVPIMVKEVITGLAVTAGKHYIDATVGGGGHAVEIVKKGGVLLGIDADSEAVEFTREKLKSQITNPNQEWKIVHGNFREITKIATKNGFAEVDGILFDLGVSSHQLDMERRGFSYRFGQGCLDLRFDQDSGQSAAQLLKHLSQEELSEIIAKYGEEERAREIAAALVHRRRTGNLVKINDLSHAVAEVVNHATRNEVLSRVFQALRIVVNDEIKALTEGLSQTSCLLNSGGRLAVISFHSLEDRVVKQFMRGSAWKNLTPRPIRTTEAEVKVNRRARSAKLRIAQKL